LSLVRTFNSRAGPWLILGSLEQVEAVKRDVRDLEWLPEQVLVCGEQHELSTDFETTRRQDR
jgi:hypothetical protein